MDAQQSVAWLHRRAGFGLHPGELTKAVEAGPEATLATMLESSALPSTNPWEGLDLDPQNQGRRKAVRAWVANIMATTRPYVDRRTWLLHGWLVSALDKVRAPEMMVEQIRLYDANGGGDFGDLLRRVSIDRAMLFYLDGRLSTGRAPNENYGRELMELFSLGVGNYTEADVQAAARALTGWTLSRSSDTAVFVERRHDDTPQQLLGIAGVHDVDTVIDAIVAQPAHARFVAERITREYLGDPQAQELDGVVDELVAAYLANERRLDAVIERALRLGLDGTSTPRVVAPFPWLMMISRAAGIEPGLLLRGTPRGIGNTGQIPMLPPDVSGWPTGTEWFTSASLIARAELAAQVAEATRPDQPIAIAADDGDLDTLAQHLGLGAPFTTSTTAAIRSADNTVARLTLAFSCPENLLS